MPLTAGSLKSDAALGALSAAVSLGAGTSWEAGRTRLAGGALPRGARSVVDISSPSGFGGEHRAWRRLPR